MIPEKNTQVVFESPQPDTELHDICNEVEQLISQFPQILCLIAQDQEKAAKAKKKMRILDKQWWQDQLVPIPECGLPNETEIEIEKLDLLTGKKRMVPELVLFFMLIRGYIGGFKSKTTQTLIRESFTVHNFLSINQWKIPGWSTIIDNINYISNATRSVITNSQLMMVQEEGLDDFKELTIDSTAVSANACWPTDSGILLQLVERIWRLGQTLDHFGLNNMQERRFIFIIKKLREYHLTVCLSAGKKNSKKKIKQIYRKILKEASSALKAFEKEMFSIEESLSSLNIRPTKKLQLSRRIELMNSDVENLKKVISYSTERIEHEKNLKAKDKIMSTSDSSAAYIQKGQREAVIGFKPQLGRSKNGLITCIITPEGNAADSTQLVPMVEQHIERTNIIPDIVSTDDGYSSAKGKAEVEDKGVKSVSINGAKGKRITSEEDWESALFAEARNQRSAVESLMFTIKYNHNFGKLMRRGIASVRAELLEKVIAYNLCRIIQLRKKRQAKIKKEFLLSAA